MEGVIRILEIDDPNVPVPEGRLAVAETPAPSVSAHPNGALGLIEAILCVHGNHLQEFLLRYEKYLNVKAGAENNLNIFELGGSRIIIVTDSLLETILPGEKPPALPALVAYTIKVENIEHTRKVLLKNGFTPQKSHLGGLFVPSTEALGVAVMFRQGPHLSSESARQNKGQVLPNPYGGTTC